MLRLDSRSEQRFHSVQNSHPPTLQSHRIVYTAAFKEYAKDQTCASQSQNGPVRQKEAGDTFETAAAQVRVLKFVAPADFEKEEHNTHTQEICAKPFAPSLATPKRSTTPNQGMA